MLIMPSFKKSLIEEQFQGSYIKGKEADNNDRLKVMIINLRNTNMIKTIDGIFHKHSKKKDLKCKYFD